MSTPTLKELIALQDSPDWQVEAEAWAEMRRRLSKETMRAVYNALEAFMPYVAEIDRLRHEDDSTCIHRIEAKTLRNVAAALRRLDGGQP